MTVRLRGITWDHPRGYSPLAENAAKYTELHPGIEIEWRRRSLRAFGVQPVEELAAQFDLIVIDHPFVGRAKSTGCLRDLRPLFPVEFHAMLARESVGPSTRSYDFGGVFGLPTDAACQVASYRPDLLEALNTSPPRSFAETLELGRRARKAGKWLALPSCQSDSSCLVATLAANLGHPIRPGCDAIVEPDAFDTLLGRLADLAALSHPSSCDWNPIATYDAMSTGDDIVYAPFAFGYTNYSRAGLAKPIHFTTIAGPGADPTAGAILGGAGCAISSACRHVDAAVAYLSWVHRPEHQKGAYFEHGGQPGLRAAWTDAQVNAACANFFAGSLETIDKAYLRPRFDGFIPACEHMGLLVHRWLKEGGSRAALIVDANETYARACEKASGQLPLET